MKKINLLIFYSFLSLILCASHALKCGKEKIENCTKCGTGDSVNSCGQCNDKYFPVINNLYCLPCGDPIFGQIGCEGNCNSSNILNDRLVMCNENDCKEGYYNLNGICFKCSEGLDSCKKCSTILKSNGEKEYRCDECLNNEYIINDYGQCIHCSLDHCKKCHYTNVTGIYMQECDECDSGYFVNRNKTCQKCYLHSVSIPNGDCDVCTDDPEDLEFGSCRCDYRYTKKNHSSCIKCPQNCDYCTYDNQTHKTNCTSCYSGYVINSEKTCTFCGEGCEYCYLSNNSEPICTDCYSGTFVSYNNCLICPDGCKACEYNDKNQINCTKCKSQYALLNNGTCEKCPSGCYKCKASDNGEIECLDCYGGYALKSKKECHYCQNIKQEGMIGCESCGYNENTTKFECHGCRQKQREDSYEWYDIYTFVTNTFQCFNNSDPNGTAFYGCLLSYYNETSGKYECQTCNNYRYSNEFIMVTNEKICKESYKMNLMNCYEAQNIGTEKNPIYSCIKCYNNSAKIIDKDNRTNCYSRNYNNLSYCLEGAIDETSEVKCTECVSNAHLNSSGICECNSDSFGKYYELCYKCDDINNGIPGCNAEKGCSNYFYSNDQLNCNECKDGYFQYDKGQCYSCSFEINNCEKCHYDESTNKLICDKCPDEYNYNPNEKKCELKNCEEYPEISEGCIICEGNREKYISEKKCQKCKIGYLKTKEGQCSFCRSEENGGPACYKCKYKLNEEKKETDNIICEYCPEKGHVLSSDGKCYNCKKITPNCEECWFIKNPDNTEKLSCTICAPGYYLNSKGKCVYYLKYLEKIPDCYRYFYTINNISFCPYYSYSERAYYFDSYYPYCRIGDYNFNYHYYYYYSYSLDEYKNYLNSNITLPEINTNFQALCIQCKSGYFLNSDGNCINLEECSLISIYENINENYLKCRDFCYYYDTINVELTYKKKNISEDSENNNKTNNIVTLDAEDFFHSLYYGYTNYNKTIIEDYNEYLKPLFIKAKLCILKPEDSKAFENCRKVQYDGVTNSYKCSECYSSYILDTESNTCKYLYNEDYLYDYYDCEIENIGNNSNPIYSCQYCYDDQYYTLISTENNVKYCEYNRYGSELYNCKEANADTTFINTVYNCNSCSSSFLPYYSKFYGRKICQNIFEKIITKKEISLAIYNNIVGANATNGTCEKKYFTPNGKKCYKCNDEIVGIPGCKGNCSFSLERNNILKCEGVCKSGYIEVSEGVCESCDNVNHGCYECNYTNDYPDNYLGIKRKRRFICYQCDAEYIKIDGKCMTCMELGLNGCDECEADPQNNNKYICTKCNKYSILKDGYCNMCYRSYEFIKDNKCLYCNDYNNGGIKGCKICEKNNNEVICRLCQEGYILLKNNNTCLNISENKELENYDYCEELTLDSNKLFCSRCKSEYSLLKENDNDKGKCTKIQALYDNDINNNYYRQFFYHEFYDYKKKSWIYYYDEDYYYYRNYINYPCQESINLGTKDKPIYSCTKCFKRLENDKPMNYRDYEEEYTLIKRNNVSFCIQQYRKKELENCTEAINNTKDGIEKYDCLTCSYENERMYDFDAEIHYCLYKNIAKKCVVKYCKTCKSGNNYFCNECLLSNYEVNSLTGSCVEKTEVVPAITFKDIFRLELNSNKTINGQTIYGPSLILRGITSSQINTGHAFLIYLTFKIKSSRNRHLQEEEKIIPAFCEALNSVEESYDDINIIDNECIGNATQEEDFTKYQLDDIDEGENKGLLKKSNLKELVTEMKNEGVGFEREEPKFTIVELLKYVTFEMNKIQNITAKNYIFDFKIDGKINREVPNKSIDTELELNEIEDKATCNFKVEEDKNATLSCIIDINKYKDQEIFSFKTAEIKTDENDFYLAKIDEVLLINKKEEGKKKNYTILISICVSAGVVVITAIIIITIVIIRKYKKKNQVSGKIIETDKVI